MKSIITLLFICCCSMAISQSVNIQGDPYNGNPYSNIQSAIDASVNPNDVILVTGEHTESLSIQKSITIIGADPANDIVQAAANPSSDGSGNNVINIVRDQAADALVVTLENLGIRNGNSGTTNGGGLNIDKATGLVTLKNCKIENNYSAQRGGGLSSAGSNVDIINCSFINNVADLDGGAMILASNNGAGINSTINIKHSLIDSNQGRNGGGLYINGNNSFGDDYLIDVNIENSTISQNSASSGSGAVGGGSIWSQSHTWTTNAGGDGTSGNVSIKLIHTTIYGNTHSANNKSGMRATGSNVTNLNAYNSIIVAEDLVGVRAINFSDFELVDIANCILGGLQNLSSAQINKLDATNSNNVRGKTASFAGLSGILTNAGGPTSVVTISKNSNSDDYCTATISGITIPSSDQTGYERTSPQDAGAYEVRCDAPTGSSLINTAATAASFSFTEFNDADNGYEWVVVESGDDPNNSVDTVATGTVNSGNSRTSVIGLSNNTLYEFYLRSVCGSTEFSAWATPIAFSTSFQGNLIVNSRFQDANGDPTLDQDNDNNLEWQGYGTSARVDDINGENVGFINLSDGVLRQDFNVVPGVTYTISFNYRWSTTSGSINPNNLTPVIRDPNAGVIESLPALNTASDQWFTMYYAYTHPINSDLDLIRLQFFKGNNINEFNIFNITVLEDLDLSSDYDYVYKNGSWSPSAPTSAISGDDIYVFNGSLELSDDITASNFHISSYADANIYGALDLSNQLTIDSGGVLTFKSNASTTGQIKSLGITGDVRVERYIPAGNRAYRFLTSPVTTISSIRNNWQQKANNTGINYSTDNENPVQNYGTHITGDQNGNNGFDASVSGNASIFEFNNLSTGSQTYGWSPLQNTNVNNLQAGKPYLVLIRGSRSIDLSTNNTTADFTTLRSSGTPVSGSQVFDASSVNALSDQAGEFSFVANPYQAIVDLDEVTKSNVNPNFYWVWDPNLNSTSNGGYVQINIPTGTNTTLSPANEFVMPGQAFFVQTIANGTASVTFEESDKNLSATQTSVFNNSESSLVRILLYRTNALNNGERESDGLIINFSTNGYNGLNLQDGRKFMNSGENLSREIDSEFISFENRSYPLDGESLNLTLDNYVTEEYTFMTILNNTADYFNASIYDSYTGQLNSLIEGQTTFSFAVDPNIPASMNQSRFSIVFETSTLGIDPSVSLLSDLSVFPNPTDNGEITLKNLMTDNLAEIAIYNMIGQQVYEVQHSVFERSIDLDLSTLSKGSYIIKVSQGGESKSVKLIIK